MLFLKSIIRIIPAHGFPAQAVPDNHGIPEMSMLNSMADTSNFVFCQRSVFKNPHNKP